MPLQELRVTVAEVVVIEVRLREQEVMPLTVVMAIPAPAAVRVLLFIGAPPVPGAKVKVIDVVPSSLINSAEGALSVAVGSSISRR